MTVPETHPRYESLMVRDRVAEGVEKGLVAPVGLVAHGRGEAFDYLLGERTSDPARRACTAAAAALVLAAHPVMSVNGNVAVLCPEAVADLQAAVPARVEVNLFYRTEERVARLVDHLTGHGVRDVLGRDAEPLIPGLDHARARVSPEGIAKADVVVVPLEDGDRAQALRRMGKTTIVVDLNPLSRSSRTASITIVDEVRRALPLVAAEVRRLLEEGPDAAHAVLDGFDNVANLRASARAMTAVLEAFDPVAPS